MSLLPAAMIPLYIYRQSHPTNLVLLALWVSLMQHYRWPVQSLALCSTLSACLPICCMDTAAGGAPAASQLSTYGFMLSLFMALQTCTQSTSIGAICTLYQPAVVIEAVALTAAIVVGLTLYTVHATRKGVDFRWVVEVLDVPPLSLPT